MEAQFKMDLVEHIVQHGARIHVLDKHPSSFPVLLVGRKKKNYIFHFDDAVNNEFLKEWPGMIHIIKSKEDIDRIFNEE